jgi:Flp pilus assembly protein TadG
MYIASRVFFIAHSSFLVCSEKSIFDVYEQELYCTCTVEEEGRGKITSRAYSGEGKSTGTVVEENTLQCFGQHTCTSTVYMCFISNTVKKNTRKTCTPFSVHL